MSLALMFFISTMEAACGGHQVCDSWCSSSCATPLAGLDNEVCKHHICDAEKPFSIIPTTSSESLLCYWLKLLRQISVLEWRVFPTQGGIKIIE